MSYLAGFAGLHHLSAPQKLLIFAGVSVIFASFGRLVRGVSTGGAVAGAAVCFALMWGAGIGGFVALLAVFLLTWVSTRIGYTQKQKLGTAEARTGRDALQVLANLSVAALCAVLVVTVCPKLRMLAAIGAALAEAAADTVSSEIGQARGGTPRLVTTWHKADSGTDGAITLAGTLCGTVAAALTAALFASAEHLGWISFAVCAAAGLAGMLFDSVLGATLERRGLLGNNGVNFCSTIFAALLAYAAR